MKLSKCYNHVAWQITAVLAANNIICHKKNYIYNYLDSKVHGANMGPTWVLSAPEGPHVGPMNLAIRVYKD